MGPLIDSSFQPQTKAFYCAVKYVSSTSIPFLKGKMTQSEGCDLISFFVPSEDCGQKVFKEVKCPSFALDPPLPGSTPIVVYFHSFEVNSGCCTLD